MVVLAQSHAVSRGTIPVIFISLGKMAVFFKQNAEGMIVFLSNIYLFKDPFSPICSTP